MSVSRSEYMLKYQKAKVKLLEYDVPKENYPKFPLKYRDLAFPTILIMSEYADAVISNDAGSITKIKENLHFCSEFYDAAMKSREQVSHDLDFLLIGAAAYFFQENFGSAMVLMKEVNVQALPKDARGVLASIFELIFHGQVKTIIEDPLLFSFEKYIQTGDAESVDKFAREMESNAYQNSDELNAFFSDILYAVIKIALANSARQLLPLYSAIEAEKWTNYFDQSVSIKMIWPAQRLIGEKGILQGKSGIVQLPTGVGKTRSIELMIRSLFLSGRGKCALIVAPLRALCNEIADDMKKAFSDGTSINQFSDLLEFDFEELLGEAKENTVLVCTPEKLQFILHHQHELLFNIDLVIFDEGHLFDDMNRGAMYELLIEHIKETIKPLQQIVLLSAVLPNADEILTWILGKTGVLAYDERIKSTPKVIGFTSKTEEVHYFSSAFDEEDFYIPRAVRRQELSVKKSKRSKKTIFPENTPQDLALYYANQLCKNGGVAVYMGQRRSIPVILKRILELEKKNCTLPTLVNTSSIEELQKLHTFIQRYYGDDYIYTQVALKGILPHYSSLPNGLRLAVEYAFRKGLIKSVICTSTLAQGVNIPIKYLIMTSLQSAQSKISVRNLQNLTGRTARSGVYTEGSIIISDPKLYDERRKGRGYYRWQAATNMFQPQNAEVCGSAILSIVRSFIVDYETSVSGEKVVSFICDNISEDWPVLMKKALYDWLEKKGKNNALNKQTVAQRVDEYKNILGTIENEICYIMTQSGNDETAYTEKTYVAAMRIYDKSLARALGTDSENVLLKKLFEAIAKRLSDLNIDFSKIGISMASVEISMKIEKAIEDYHLDAEMQNEDNCFK